MIIALDVEHDFWLWDDTVWEETATQILVEPISLEFFLDHVHRFHSFFVKFFHWGVCIEDECYDDIDCNTDTDIVKYDKVPPVLCRVF